MLRRRAWAQRERLAGQRAPSAQANYTPPGKEHMAIKWGIVAALALATTPLVSCGWGWPTEPARAATIEQRLDKLELQNRAQARRIHTLERINAEQGAKLNWFEQCTPGPLDLGLFLDEELGNRFNTIAQALGDPAIEWQTLASPLGAMTFTLQVHPSCIHGSVNGFPWPR